MRVSQIDEAGVMRDGLGIESHWQFASRRIKLVAMCIPRVFSFLLLCAYSPCTVLNSFGRPRPTSCR